MQSYYNLDDPHMLHADGEDVDHSLEYILSLQGRRVVGRHGSMEGGFPVPQMWLLTLYREVLSVARLSREGGGSHEMVHDEVVANRPAFESIGF